MSCSCSALLSSQLFLYCSYSPSTNLEVGCLENSASFHTLSTMVLNLFDYYYFFFCSCMFNSKIIHISPCVYKIQICSPALCGVMKSLHMLPVTLSPQIVFRFRAIWTSTAIHFHVPANAKKNKWRVLQYAASGIAVTLTHFSSLSFEEKVQGILTTDMQQFFFSCILLETSALLGLRDWAEHYHVWRRL